MLVCTSVYEMSLVSESRMLLDMHTHKHKLVKNTLTVHYMY